MSTEIATAELTKLEATRFLAIRPGSTVAEALEANLSSGERVQVSDLTSVGLPSGGTTKFSFEDIEGEVTVPAITGALVYYGPHGVLWPSNETTEGATPLLVTHDLRIAHKRGDDYGDMDREGIEACRLEDGTYDWQKLPQNKFGSGKNGHGKRCKEQRYLCVLREEDTFPLLVRVSPASLRNITSFIKKLNVPYWQTVVELTLEKATSKSGQPYAKMKIRLVERLDKSVGDVIKQTYVGAIGEAVREAAESEMMNSAEDDLE